MSGSFHDGTFDQVWRAGSADLPFKTTAGRFSWRVSLSVIAGLSMLGWGAAGLGLIRLLGA
jgi:hypothetical protein